MTGTEHGDRDVTRADFVVVGAGIAGLTAAIRAVEAGLDVVILNKGPHWESGRAEQSTSTFYAQGGVAVVTVDDPHDPGDPTDSVDLHLRDTLAAGAGLTDPRSARPILSDGFAAVSGLISWGAEFDRRPDGRLSRTREGGHSVRRIIHAGGDATGARIQQALGAAVTELGGRRGSSTLVCHDDAIATQVLLDGDRAVGVAYRKGGRERVVLAPTVLLATGGAGHLYAATTNPSGATADGVALALRAGASVADLEFIQFHPTMLHTDGGRGRRTLISEAVRGEGGRLVDVDGRSVTAGVHPLGDLAPRDVVANAVEAAIENTGHPCVYLDVTGVDDFTTRFPTVTAGIVAAGLDPADGRIPVVPGAHYLCGGVVTDAHGRTAVPGLLAAGEVARTGLHGANRLASNSLLEGLVMGRRTAAVAESRRAERVVEVVPGSVAVPVIERKILQDSMSRHVALRRDAAGLDAVAELLDDPEMPSVIASTVSDIEDSGLRVVARAVVAAASARTESRGSHVRLDHPETDAHGISREFRLVDGRIVDDVVAAAR